MLSKPAANSWSESNSASLHQTQGASQRAARRADRPFEMLLDPQVNANALTWAADANKARTSTNVSVGKGSSLVRAVEARGLEPLTPCLQSRCATNCAMPP